MGLKNYLARMLGFLTLDELSRVLSPGSTSMSGEYVSAETVQRLFAVYACVNVLAETLATLPPKLYRVGSGDEREVVKDHPFALTLKRPNPTDTTFEFFERIMWHLTLRGRFFAIKIKVFGVVRNLIPIENPDSVSVLDTKDHGYEFTYEGRTYTQDEMLFIIVHDGKSIIRYQADTFGKNQAINRYGSSFFKNGAMPSIVVTTPKTMDQSKVDHFKKLWEDTYGSSKNANKMAILDDGKTIEKLSVTNEDSQFLETNKYSDSQICGLFRVPVYMIGNYDKATFSNIENLGQQFARFTMAPWCRRIETAITNQCLQPEKDLYCEFFMDSLERGNLLSRYQAYQVGRNAGFLSANEIRRKENMNPFDGGDEYLVPLNNTTTGGDA